MKTVNMCIRRQMEVLLNSLHEILSEAFATLAIPGGCVDGQLMSYNDASGDWETAEQREQSFRDLVEQAKHDKASNTRNIWGLVCLTQALRMEAEEVVKECALWDDSDSGHKKDYSPVSVAKEQPTEDLLPMGKSM
ncbi:uncharacterized protein EDB91DRAFT_1259721 [Suillus paluster]|uniref:uncharacterized protein n=1 Tax=Suillus paluster TaxID=48578 RepID=UPI001B8637D6|nr:uncharacterized protein EDB91DRAFT_1259721 [Suillus paluster]KAG1717454.1 hypothetical protein EDB91DRAFT_1259721 [Suillus paluster]